PAPRAIWRRCVRRVVRAGDQVDLRRGPAQGCVCTPGPHLLGLGTWWAQRARGAAGRADRGQHSRVSRPAKLLQLADELSRYKIVDVHQHLGSSATAGATDEPADSA